MSLTRAEVIAWLEGLSSLELGALIDGLQQRLGVTVTPTPPPFTTMGAPLTTDDDPEPSQRVRLTAVGPRKVRVLQALREHLPLALHDAVHLLETMPVELPAGPSLAKARALVDDLRAAGATAELADQAAPRL